MDYSCFVAELVSWSVSQSVSRSVVQLLRPVKHPIDRKAAKSDVDDRIDSLAGHDLVDDLIEMPSLFANRELDKIIADIPNFISL